MWSKAQRAKLTEALIELLIPADSSPAYRRDREYLEKVFINKIPWPIFYGICEMLGVSSIERHKEAERPKITPRLVNHITIKSIQFREDE